MQSNLLCITVLAIVCRMDIKEVVDYYGSQNKLAKTLGIARQNITRWLEEGCIPLLQQYRIEEITKGKFKRGTKTGGRRA